MIAPKGTEIQTMNKYKNDVNVCLPTQILSISSFDSRDELTGAEMKRYRCFLSDSVYKTLTLFDSKIAVERLETLREFDLIQITAYDVINSKNGNATLVVQDFEFDAGLDRTDTEMLNSNGTPAVLYMMETKEKAAKRAPEVSTEQLAKAYKLDEREETEIVNYEFLNVQDILDRGYIQSGASLTDGKALRVNVIACYATMNKTSQAGNKYRAFNINFEDMTGKTAYISCGGKQATFMAGIGFNWEMDGLDETCAAEPNAERMQIGKWYNLWNVQFGLVDKYHTEFKVSINTSFATRWEEVEMKENPIIDYPSLTEVMGSPDKSSVSFFCIVHEIGAVQTFSTCKKRQIIVHDNAHVPAPLDFWNGDECNADGSLKYRFGDVLFVRSGVVNEYKGKKSIKIAKSTAVEMNPKGPMAEKLSKINLERKDIPILPSNYKFYTIAEIVTAGNLVSGQKISLHGFVNVVDEVREVTGKENGKKFMLRDVSITDATYTLKCTFWGGAWADQDGFDLFRAHDLLMLLDVDFKIDKDGGKSLSFGFGSKMSVNPPSETATAIRKEYDTARGSTTFLPIATVRTCVAGTIVAIQGRLGDVTHIEMKRHNGDDCLSRTISITDGNASINLCLWKKELVERDYTYNEEVTLQGALLRTFKDEIYLEMMEDASIVFRPPASNLAVSSRYLMLGEALAKPDGSMFDIKFLYDGGDRVDGKDILFNIVGETHDGVVRLRHVAHDAVFGMQYRSAYFMTNAIITTEEGDNRRIMDTAESVVGVLGGEEADALVAVTL